MTPGLAQSCYVVDDDRRFRTSLLTLLGSVGYVCEGFAAAGDFLAGVPRLEPGVLLLDLRGPELTGLDLLESQGAALEPFAVMMISGHGDISGAVRSIKAGALDFIEKPFGSEKLLPLVKIAHQMLSRRTSANALRRDALARIATLSPREAEVLRLLVAGAPNKIIARTLDLSVRTVEMHRANMLAKLCARSTAEAIHLGMIGGVEPWPLARRPVSEPSHFSMTSLA